MPRTATRILLSNSAVAVIPSERGILPGNGSAVVRSEFAAPFFTTEARKARKVSWVGGHRGSGHHQQIVGGGSGPGRLPRPRPPLCLPSVSPRKHGRHGRFLGSEGIGDPDTIHKLLVVAPVPDALREPSPLPCLPCFRGEEPGRRTRVKNQGEKPALPSSGLFRTARW